MFSFGTSKFKRTSGGANVPHYKNTAEVESVLMDVKNSVTILMSQHIGSPCNPCVKVGDEVFVGTLIGETEGFLSVPIHSSVSGKVSKITDVIATNGSKTKAVVIETDKKQTVDPSIKPPVINDKEEFVQAIKNSGLVGLGGAAFPTFVKLAPKNLDDIDTLIVNGAECEPFITSDYRECMENPHYIISGISTVMKYLNIKKALVGIENNKPKAIDLLRGKSKDNSGIEIVSLQSVYPQGGEKVLINEMTGKVLKEGQLPSDQGMIVLNITTLSKLAQFIETGMPLTTKKLTVDGDGVKKPCNLIVPIGTSIKDVLEFCETDMENLNKVLLGGPMMGTALHSLDFPVLKGTNALLTFTKDFAYKREELACMRCARCVTVCPMNLTPPSIEDAMYSKDYKDLNSLKVNICIECGCCSFVCPSKRPVTQHMRLAKMTLRENK